MAIITCPECGRHPVSDRATACPQCGCPLGESAASSPVQTSRPQPSAHSLDGTKWEPVGPGNFRVVWYFDVGGTFWIDSEKFETGMRQGTWSQQGDSVKTTMAWGYGGGFVFEGKVTRTGDSIVGQMSDIGTSTKLSNRLEIKRVH